MSRQRDGQTDVIHDLFIILAIISYEGKKSHIILYNAQTYFRLEFILGDLFSQLLNPLNILHLTLCVQLSHFLSNCKTSGLFSLVF